MLQRKLLFLLGAALATPSVLAEGVESSGPTVYYALIVSLVLGVIFFTSFLILRPRFPNVFAPRTFRTRPSSRNTKPLPDGFLNWIPQFARTPDKEILRLNGMDAYSFISFLNMLLWIWVPMWIFTWIVLMPLFDANLKTPSGTNQFAFGNIVTTSRQQQNRSAGALIVHYICLAWLVLNVHWRMKHFVRVRQQFLLSPQYASSVQARTMLVTGVPNEMLSETKLSQHYGNVPEGVQRVFVNRNLKDLPKMCENRDKLVKKMEGAVTKLIKAAWKSIKKGKVEGYSLDVKREMSLEEAERIVPEKKRPHHRLGKIPCIGEKVDTINYCRNEIPRLNGEIDQQRQMAETDYAKFPPQSSAFVLFNNYVGARLSLWAEKPHYLSDQYLDCHPDDIVWSNLNLNPYEKRTRKVLFWALTMATVIFWTALVALVGAISNLDGLKKKVKFLSWIDSIPDQAQGFIKSILPTAMLALLNMLLPPWLRFHARQSGAPTHNAVELSLMLRFFIFQVVQNFIVLMICSGISSAVDEFSEAIHDPSKFVSQIAKAMPQASTFFLTFVIYMTFWGAASSFLQLVALIIYYVKLKILSSTPRTVWHLKNDMGAPQWGVLFPLSLLVVIYALGYMVLQPIMNGFAAAAFFTYYLSNRYLFLYVYNCKPQTETVGMFFLKAISYTFVGAYVGTLVIALMYFFNSGSNNSFVAMGVLTIVLLALVAVYHYFLLDSLKKIDHALPARIMGHNNGEPVRVGILGLGDPAFRRDVTTPEGSGALPMETSILGKILTGPNPDIMSNFRKKPHTEEPLAVAGSTDKTVDQTVGQTEDPYSTPMEYDSSTGQLVSGPSALPEKDAYYANTLGAENVPMKNMAQGYGETAVQMEDPAALEAKAQAERQQQTDSAFYNPARKSVPLTLWYPDDNFGIGRAEAVADQSAGFQATTEHAWLNAKGKVEEDAYVPPGE